MNKEIQLEVLAYFIRHKSHLLSNFKANWFTTNSHQEIFKLIQLYYSKYKRTPSISVFSDFISEQTDCIYTDLLDRLYKIEINQEYVESKLIIELQKALYKDVMDSEYDSLKSADDKVLAQILKKFSDIHNLSKKQEIIKSVNPFERKVVPEKKQIWPTWIKNWNAMMTKGGFSTPELIILLAGPKAFKTGFLINLAINYALDGANVLCIDWENGIDAYTTRLQQALFKLSYAEYQSSEYDTLISKNLKNLDTLFKGGGVRLLSLNAMSDSLDLVDNEVTRLINEEGFKPDMIIYDYLDLSKCTDSRITDTRFQLRHIYLHAIRLNKKYDCFSISPSQANRAAISKPVYSMVDFAEDFGKVMNAHASFALCRTKDELLNKRARLCVVFQRQGIPAEVPGSICDIHIDEDTMVVEQILNAEDEFDMPNIF